MRKSFWLLISITLFVSCGKESIVPDLGLDYYPIVIGDYRIYDVKETTYLFEVPSDETYQLRETFIDEIFNGSDTSYLLRIEKRELSSDPWQSIKSIYVRQTNQFLEYRENNQSFIRMTFPIKFCEIKICKEVCLNELVNLNGGECSKWDGNAQNQENTEFHHYRKLESGDYTFGQTDHIKLVLTDLPPNNDEQDQRFEIYAKGIGLIDRNFIHIFYCQENGVFCGGETPIIDNGTILSQKLTEYGSL